MFKLFVCLLLYSNLILTSTAYADDIYVAAATSLTHVLEEIASEFESETQHVVKLSFASSGNLAYQIIKGAPFELFLSADETYISLLRKKELTDGVSHVYGIGYLVLYVPTGSSILPSEDMSTLANSIQTGQLKRLAIANPEHAPYGLIAKEALENAHIWESVMPYIVFGKSASQAAQFALSRTVDATLIPYSLALINELSNKGQFVLLNDSLYKPLEQPMVLMQNASDAAKEFYHFILGDKAQNIFQQHGMNKIVQSD